MNSQFQVYFSCFLLFFAVAATTLPSGNETDQLALLALKSQIMEDPFNLFSSWNESIHFCQWRGVTCGRQHQRVVILDLQSQKLAGSISPYIGNLSFLRVLHLQNNSFSHVIPPELGRLKRLEFFHVHNNSIGGEIPVNLSGCSSLVDFDVAYNRLVGELPVEFGSLSKLQVIHIARNELRGGIPSSYANLSSLQKFSAAINNFQGSILDTFGKLANLKTIALAENRLSGSIPSLIFNMSSLKVFDVEGNQINGSLPSELGNTLRNIQFFSIASNQFTGSIPFSISNASNLSYLAIGGNKLTGGVPILGKLHKLYRFSVGGNYLGSGHSGDLGFVSSLTNATGLVLLDLHFNNFGGVLTETMGNLSANLRKIYLQYNQISGRIPLGIGNLVNLERIWLFANQLTGSVPFNTGKLQRLQELDFSENELSGDIPSSLGNLSLLIELDLSQNNLQGTIPLGLGTCSSLFSLRLAQNNLSGPIPQLVIGLSSLSYLDLSENYLTGSLPVEVGKLKNLGYLSVYDNVLSGEIPGTIGSCVRLETLLMDGNLFQGHIPLSLSSLRGIQFLDLSRNKLSGRIPEYFKDFGILQSLNLSNNDFEGAVPTEGIFANASAISVTGNGKLCGGVPELGLSACNSKWSKKKSLTLTSELAISISSALLGLIFLSCFLYIRWFRKTGKNASSGSPTNSLLQVSYQSLLKATDGFSSANLIGVGSFGSVYKGILEHDETVVAVKVLNLQRHGASKSFIAECEALRNIKHRNLVKILTVCSGVDYEGNDFKALVYDFMVNGSLEEWLHPVTESDELHNEPAKLDLHQRLNISIDVACALEYLHQHCHTPIVHCDLKPSNILLNKDMTGHVGDFGLAKFLQESTRECYASQGSSIGVRGSIGYIAPEYAMRSEVTMAGDVYSYGILLLEMFTGKRPTDDMFNDSLSLHKFVKLALPSRVDEVADSVLLQGAKEEKTQDISVETRDCLTAILQIGVACSEGLPKARMKISDVAAELHSIRSIFLET